MLSVLTLTLLTLLTLPEQGSTFNREGWWTGKTLDYESANCDFENGACGWTSDVYLSPSVNWTRTLDEGNHIMAADMHQHPKSTVARLASPLLTTTRTYNHTLQVHIHIPCSDVYQLSVFLETPSSNTLIEVLEPGTLVWHVSRVYIPPTETNHRIVLEGQKISDTPCVSRKTASISIDDIVFGLSGNLLTGASSTRPVLTTTLPPVTDPTDDKLPMSAIAGIVCGGVGLVIVCIVAVAVAMVRKRNRQGGSMLSLFHSSENERNRNELPPIPNPSYEPEEPVAAGACSTEQTQQSWRPGLQLQDTPDYCNLSFLRDDPSPDYENAPPRKVTATRSLPVTSSSSLTSSAVGGETYDSLSPTRPLHHYSTLSIKKSKTTHRARKIRGTKVLPPHPSASMSKCSVGTDGEDTGKGREATGGEGRGREGRGKGRDGTLAGKGREGTGKGREGTGKEGRRGKVKGREGTGHLREGTGKGREGTRKAGRVGNGREGGGHSDDDIPTYVELF